MQSTSNTKLRAEYIKEAKYHLENAKFFRNRSEQTYAYAMNKVQIYRKAALAVL